MRAATALWTTTLIGILATGCGGGGKSTPLTIGDFCNQKATAECTPAVKACVVVTMDACMTARTAACMQFAASAAVSPRVFTQSNVGNCISKTKSAYAKTTITPKDFSDVDDACNYVFQGNVANLMLCTIKYDCAGSPNALICDKGFCAKPVTKNKGEQCSDKGAICATGSYCLLDTATTTYSCVAKAGPGAPCDASTPCLENLRCAGTCTDRIPAGGSCSSNGDCVSSAPYCDRSVNNICDQGLTFSPSAPSCAEYGGGTGAGGSGGTGAGGSGGTGAGGSGGTGAGGAAGADASAAGG
jgi:uncharacterized membrane protein YgcG